MIEKIEPIKSIFQTIFYIVATILAILTYKNAKKSILSPVNTEYQKRIFDRLSEVTDYICSEFQMGRPEYYLYQQPMKETLKEIVEEYEGLKDKVVDDGNFYITDYPTSPEWIKFKEKHDEVQFDPYIPEKLKKPILDYFSKRANAAMCAHDKAVQKFIDSANKNGWSSVINFENISIENFYFDALRNEGIDYGNLKKEVDGIKGNFQKYMESFQP